jgi:hypothetical protein
VSSRRTTADERAETNPLQFYRTPPWVTWLLVKYALSRLGPGLRIVELGSGDGFIAKEILSCLDLEIESYVAVELDKERAALCHQVISPLGGKVLWADVLTLSDFQVELLGRVDVIIMNPPFDKAHLFLLSAQGLVRDGGWVYMLQRCTYPGAADLDRDLFFLHDNPLGLSLGYFGEICMTNRIDFRGDGASDSVNHSWFGFSPGQLFAEDFSPTRLWRRRMACPWDPNRESKLPSQKWDGREDKQLALL